MRGNIAQQGKERGNIVFLTQGRGGEGVAKEVKVDQTFCEHIRYDSK